jgi:hypothetical protein
MEIQEITLEGMLPLNAIAECAPITLPWPRRMESTRTICHTRPNQKVGVWYAKTTYVPNTLMNTIRDNNIVTLSIVECVVKGSHMVFQVNDVAVLLP